MAEECPKCWASNTRGVLTHTKRVDWSNEHTAPHRRNNTARGHIGATANPTTAEKPKFENSNDALAARHSVSPPVVLPTLLAPHQTNHKPMQSKERSRLTDHCRFALQSDAELHWNAVSTRCTALLRYLQWCCRYRIDSSTI